MSRRAYSAGTGCEARAAGELAPSPGITAVDDLTRTDLFESNDEHDAFLVDVYAFRQRPEAT